MARVGAARMAQSTHRTESVLISEKDVFWYNFWYKMYEKKSHARIRTRYLVIRQIFFENE